MERKFEDLTNNFPTNEKILSLPDVNEVFNTQLDKKVSSGFHKYLNQTEEEYRKGYGLLSNLLLKLTSQDRGVLSLVETRIPFVTQTDLLRITRDPSLFYNPQERLNSQPYIALLKVIKHNDPLFAYESTVEGKIKKSTEEFQLATPFECINSSIEDILKDSFVILAGGMFEPRQGRLSSNFGLSSAPVLDTYFGKPRLAQVSMKEKDGLLGVLVSKRLI